MSKKQNGLGHGPIRVPEAFFISLCLRKILSRQAFQAEIKISFPNMICHLETQQFNCQLKRRKCGMSSGTSQACQLWLWNQMQKGMQYSSGVLCLPSSVGRLKHISHFFRFYFHCCIYGVVVVDKYTNWCSNHIISIATELKKK